MAGTSLTFIIRLLKGAFLNIGSCAILNIVGELRRNS